MIVNYRRFVVGNLLWYEDRFEQYADILNTKVAYSPVNEVPGTVPRPLHNLGPFRMAHLAKHLEFHHQPLMIT